MERAAGVASLLAGAVHGVAAPSHLEEWWGYGLFFIAAAAAQVLFGLALLTDAINAKDFGPSAPRARRALYVGGIVGNVAVLALYVVTRTLGIPFVGPDSGEVEGVGALDLAAAILEVALVLMLVALLSRRSARAEQEAPRVS